MKKHRRAVHRPKNGIYLQEVVKVQPKKESLFVKLNKSKKMVIGFKPQFVKPILDGTKIHTMRSDKKERWKPRMQMHMATGVRTRRYWNFNTTPLISTQFIYIGYKYKHFPRIFLLEKKSFYYVKVRRLSPGLLWRNDGFSSPEAFFQWFNKSAIYKLLHWTNYKY